MWLHWGYGLKWDAATYIHFGQWWVEGNFFELAREWSGMILCPNVYHAALGAMVNVAPGILYPVWTRPAVAAVQVATFAS